MVGVVLPPDRPRAAAARTPSSAEVTIAVVMDTPATPKNMTNTATTLLNAVWGMTSPYPTVVTVCAAHQIDSPKVSNSPGARNRTTVAASSVISRVTPAR